MSGKITITNQKGPVAVIDIEGVIGVPEQWQFEEPGERVTTYETFRSVIESLKDVCSPEIVVNIRSTGGNVNDALLIYDTLSALDARISTRCYGYVASAATIIAQAASAGCREISSNSLYLIHKSVCSTEGNASEISQTIGMLEKTDQRIASIYAARSSKPNTQFAELMCENNGNGRWLSPDEVLAFSLADRIIAATVMPENAAELIINMGLPPIPEKHTKKMNISKRWNAILEIFGLTPEKEESLIEDSEQSLSTELGLPNEVVESMARAQHEIGEIHNRQVAELQNRISSLESQNARLGASATVTKPKEDPSAQELKLNSNDEAYLTDVRRFK